MRLPWLGLLAFAILTWWVIGSGDPSLFGSVRLYCLPELAALFCLGVGLPSVVSIRASLILSGVASGCVLTLAGGLSSVVILTPLIAIVPAGVLISEQRLIVARAKYD